MSCSKLPPEILEHILSDCDTRTLTIASQVCTKWRNATGAPKNLGYIPRIVSTIFRHLDNKSLLSARIVCTLWRNGMDMMTACDGILPNRCESVLSTQFSKDLISYEDKTNNPFPSRIVRVAMTLNERIDNSYIFKMDALRDFGCYIKWLNLRVFSGSSNHQALMNLVRTLLTLLTYMPNLEGLIIHLSFVYDKNNTNPKFYEPDNVAEFRQTKTWKYMDILCGRIVPHMAKLKALRLVSWSPSSPETEWLYYKILQHCPNLEFLDPDLSKGLEKFSKIQSKPDKYPSQLKCLKLAMPGDLCHNAFSLMKPPLAKIYLDIFEYNYVKDPTCSKVIRIIVNNCASTLMTLSLNFYTTHETTLTPAFDLGGHGPFPCFWRSFGCSCYCHFRIQHGCFPGLCPIRPILFPYPISDAPILENLKLRGYKGSLNFLRKFKSLKTLILADFRTVDQNVFKCAQDFFNFIPSLKELYTPYCGAINVKEQRSKLVDEKYLPMYW